MILKVSIIDIKYFYFENKIDINELQSIFKIFSFYDSIREVIAFLKTLKFVNEEKDENSKL